MKTTLITSTLITLILSQLSATEHQACDGNHTDGHKHSHGVYEKIDNLDKRKTVHKKSLDEKSLVRVAEDKLQQLVIDKKINKSWLKAHKPVITRTKYKFVNDWMVVFHNPHIKHKRYNNLYIFVNGYGEIQGANYSGK